jgi:hypothetical protein
MTHSLEAWWNIGAISSVREIQEEGIVLSMIIDALQYNDNYPMTPAEMVIEVLNHSGLRETYKSIITSAKETERAISNMCTTRPTYFKNGRTNKSFHLDFTLFPLQHPAHATQISRRVFYRLLDFLRFRKSFTPLRDISSRLHLSESHVLGCFESYRDLNPGLFAIRNEPFEICINTDAPSISRNPPPIEKFKLSFLSEAERKIVYAFMQYSYGVTTDINDIGYQMNDVISSHASYLLKQCHNAYPDVFKMIDDHTILIKLDESEENDDVIVIEDDEVQIVIPNDESDTESIEDDDEYTKEYRENSKMRILVFEAYKKQMDMLCTYTRTKIIKANDKKKVKPDEFRARLDEKMKELYFDEPLNLTYSIDKKMIKIESNILKGTLFPECLPLFLMRENNIFSLQSPTIQYNMFRKPFIHFENFAFNVDVFEKFVQIFINTNAEFKNTEISVPTPTFTEKFGILNWDVAFTPAQWLVDVLTRCKLAHKLEPRQFNPVLLKNGTVLFLRSGTHKIVIDEFIELLQMLDCAPFAKTMYPKDISSNYDLKGFLSDSTKTVAVLGWQHHARFAYKDIETKQLVVMDPWKQHIDFPWLSVCEQMGYFYRFAPRRVDQGKEGTCSFIALTRALMLAQGGLEASTTPLDPNCIMIVHILYSRFRDSEGRLKRTRFDMVV